MCLSRPASATSNSIPDVVVFFLLLLLFFHCALDRKQEETIKKRKVEACLTTFCALLDDSSVSLTAQLLLSSEDRNCLSCETFTRNTRDPLTQRNSVAHILGSRHIGCPREDGGEALSRCSLGVLLLLALPSVLFSSSSLLEVAAARLQLRDLLFLFFSSRNNLFQD